MKQIKTEFAKLNKQFLKVESLANTGQSELYYKEQGILQEMARQFIRLDFSVLNGKQLLRLCHIMSSHRPVQPFSFLVFCSLRDEKISRTPILTNVATNC